MNLVVVTPPAVEPVSLAEIYTFLRLDPSGSPPEHPDDAMLASQIASARQKVEETTRRALVPQRLRLLLPCAPSDRVLFGSGAWGDEDDYYLRPRAIRLPKPPLLEVHSVKYYDTDNQLQTLDPAMYLVVGDVTPAQVQLVDGYTWPSTYGREDAVQVEYSAGYAPAGSPPEGPTSGIPDSAISAVKFEVQLQYDELAPEKRDQIEATIERLLRSLKLPKF